MAGDGKSEKWKLSENYLFWHSPSLSSCLEEAKKKQSASLDMGRKERKVENNGENSSKFVAGIGNQQAARDFRIKAPTALLQMEL